MAARGKLSFLKTTKDGYNSVLWVQAVGFTFTIGLSWLTEAVRLPSVSE